MFNRNDESGHPCLVPDLKRFQPFTVEYDVSCGLVIYGLYYAVVHSFYTQFVESFFFYHERMLYFVKCFFYIY